MVCHALLPWTTFCHTSPSWPVRLGWPHTAGINFIELDTTVVLWSDWLAVCDCGFSLSALWCPLSAPTILLGFLLPWTWGLSSQLLQQSAAAAPYLGRGVAPLSHASEPSQPPRYLGSQIIYSLSPEKIKSYMHQRTSSLIAQFCKSCWGHFCPLNLSQCVIIF